MPNSFTTLQRKNVQKENLTSAAFQDICCNNGTAESQEAYFTSFSCPLPTLDKAANFKNLCISQVMLIDQSAH